MQRLHVLEGEVRLDAAGAITTGLTRLESLYIVEASLMGGRFEMRESRLYQTQDFCPVARTLNVVGDRWTILVLRELSWGRKRYSQLLAELRGISTNLLAERLKKLEDADMIQQVPYSHHPPRFEYRLTEKGRAFVPVLRALRDYGERWEARAAPSRA